MNAKYRNAIFSALILAIYVVIRYAAPFLRDEIGGEDRLFRLLGYYGTYSLPVVLYVLIRVGFRDFLPELGLNKGFLRALLWGFVFTLPMLLGYGILGKWNVELGLWSILIGAVCPAVFEELLFRAFVFGQLFRRHKWGFLPAAGINALVFGAAHLWQGNSFGETAAVFLITFGGAVWFAWMYVEWRYNLWVPVFLHFLMNLYWHMFTIDDNAMGGLSANVFRFMTVGLSIYLTIRMLKPLTIHRDKLWWQSN